MAKQSLYIVLFVLLMALIGAVGGSQAQQNPALSSDGPMVNEPVSINDSSVTVVKAAEPQELRPSDEPWVTYFVTFSNTVPTPAVLDWITDTLAPGFRFVGMAVGSDIIDPPVDPEASTIVWKGPFTVSDTESLQLSYWVEAVTVVGTYTNTVEATSDGVLIGPATTVITVAEAILSLDKSASPPAVSTGEYVTYDVTVANQGTAAGVVEVISDTLPAGFSFLRMAPESDVTSQPAGSTGTLVWTGPFTIPKGAEVHLIYQARSGGVGIKTNSVMARTADGQLLGPAESTITTMLSFVHLPLVVRNYPELVSLLEEEFTTGVPPEWVPLLVPKGWYWTGDGETWGRYDFGLDEALDKWALSMYLGEGAQEWTDYKIEATFRPGWHFRGPLVGIWLRGTYDQQSGRIGGYVFVLRPREDLIHVGYADPTAQGLDVKWPIAVPYVNELGTWSEVTIEVRGSNIKVWIGDILRIDWTDPNAFWNQGTVGFAVYRGEGQFDEIYVGPLDD